jgi:hypothetical protein
MMIKFDMYRKFTNAFAVAVVVSVGWICYEVIHSQPETHFNYFLPMLTKA